MIANGTLPTLNNISTYIGVLVLLGLNTSATARVIFRWRNEDDRMSVSLVEETGVPEGNHRPMASI